MPRKRTFYTFVAKAEIPGRKHRRTLRVEISDSSQARARKAARQKFAEMIKYSKPRVPEAWVELESTRPSCVVEVKRGKYAHGTHAKYVLEKCRCEPCKAANKRYEFERERDRLMGKPRTVDAAPVRAHVLKLMAGGMGLKRIAKAAGVGGGVMTGLLYGRKERGTPPVRWVRAATADKLMAVKVAPQTPYQVIKGAPVLAAWSMIADLLELGWSKSWIAHQVIGPKARALQLNMHGMEARHIAAIAKLWKATGPRPLENKVDRQVASRSRKQSERLREVIDQQMKQLHTERKRAASSLAKEEASFVQISRTRSVA